MRILFLSNFYPPHDLGGLEQLCYEVAVGLQRRGHHICVLTSRFGVDGKKDDGNVIRSLYLQTDIHFYRPVDFLVRRSGQERSNFAELHRAMESFNPEFIVTWGMWNMSPNLPYWAEQALPGRVAYYLASYWPSDPDVHENYWSAPARRGITEQIKRPLRRLALAQLRREGYPPKLQFRHAMCCSQYVRDTLVNSGHLPENTGVIYNGIDPEPFLQPSASRGLEKKPVRLLYFGGLLPHKGVRTAVEAMGILEQRGYLDGVDLTLIGSGHPEYEDELKKLVHSLNLENKVHFVGRISRDEIPQWLGRFDIDLFTSIWPEPLARTVMEAMAAGLLVLGTRVGGQAEMLVDGQNALCFQPEDAAGLADQIIHVLSNPSDRFKLAQAGQQMVLEKFTLRRMVDNFEGWLSGLIQSIPQSAG